MANTKASGDSGCFATVLRHLLCRHGAPTHPSDVIGDPDTNPVGPHGQIPKEGSELGVTLSSGRRAGVIARLMGLETLPDTNWVPSSKSPDAFSRSRSVNFMDYLLEVDLSSIRARRHRHRRAMTSMSFRDVPIPVSVPTLLPPPKEKDFIVLILEDRDEVEDEREIETKVKPRKREAHRKKKSDWSSKEKKVSKLRDEPRTRSRAACNHKSGQSNVRACQRRRKDMRKQVVPVADDADGSGPVSVLDKPERRRIQGNGLRKSASASSLRKAGRDESTSTRVARIFDPIIGPGNRATAKKEEEEGIEFSDSSRYLDHAVGKAHRLAEEEAEYYPSWLPPDSPSHEEICRMIEGHTLDRLIEELVRISP